MNIFRIIALFWLIVDIGLTAMSVGIDQTYLLFHAQISFIMLIISILAIIGLAIMGKSVKISSAMVFILVMGVTRICTILYIEMLFGPEVDVPYGIMYLILIIGDIFMIYWSHKFKSLET